MIGSRRRGVWGVAAATGLILLLTSGRYGYHRDELYFLAAGRHLDWGYPDQPPLVPLLARMSAWSDSLVLLRLLSTLSAVLIVVLAGDMARRMGADRHGQLLAAGATALCGFVLGTGHLLSTATFSLLGWVVITWLTLMLLQGADRRLWLAVGVVGGVTFQANPLVAVLLLALCIALRRPGPLLAGLVAFLIGLPYIVWQAAYGWPQLDIARHIADGGSGSSVSRGLLIPFLLLHAGPWLFPIWAAGFARLLRDRKLCSFAWVFAGLLLTFLVAGGKPYYLGGLFPLLFAAGAQPVVDRLPRWTRAAALLLSTPVLAFTLPVLPEHSAAWAVGVNPDAGETIGWESFADQVGRQRGDVDIVITWNYGQAGALQRYGEERVYSGHNGYGLWDVPHGRGPATLVGVPREVAAGACATPLVPRRQVRTVHGIDNDENGTTVVTCGAPRSRWQDLWPTFVHLG